MFKRLSLFKTPFKKQNMKTRLIFMLFFVFNPIIFFQKKPKIKGNIDDTIKESLRVKKTRLRQCA